MRTKIHRAALRRAMTDKGLNQTDLRVLIFFATKSASEGIKARQVDVSDALDIIRAQVSRSMLVLQQRGYILKMRNGEYSLVDQSEAGTGQTAGDQSEPASSDEDGSQRPEQTQ